MATKQTEMPKIHSRNKTKEILGIFLFVFFAVLYIYCLPPTLAPYRDAGEMACDVYTLGIPHPPGYPLYVLLGKIWTFIVPGNFAWRLNLFSAVCGILSLYLFFLVLSGYFSPIASFLIILLFGFNFTFQTVSSVSEMYSLNFLFIVILIFLCLEIYENYSFKKIMLFSFLTGLFMTNRMDMVLALPAMLVLIAPVLIKKWKGNYFKNSVRAFLFFGLGFSVYLYLPIRSSANPLLDWNHPANIQNFIGSITRKSYGSTLDLISRNYKLGELFFPNLKYYMIHILENFNFAVIFVFFGVYWEYIRNKKRFWMSLVLFLIPGPVFLLLANMPPNPHALAIVEPNYLIPDIALIWWSVAGLTFLLKNFAKYSAAVYLVTAFSVFLTAYRNLPLSNRRWNFMARDYSDNVMKSVPPDSILVVKKDVQLFSLWYYQIVEKKRQDLKIIAQGLSGSKWYQNSHKKWNPELNIFNLNTGGESEWEKMARFNKSGVYSTMDVELAQKVPGRPRGLVNELYPKETFNEKLDFWNFFNLQWIGMKYPDFFTRDLATSHAQSVVASSAFLSSKQSLSPESAEKINMSGIMDDEIPDAFLYAGFYYSNAGDWNEAKNYFKKSVDAYEKMLKLTRKYRSLESLKDSISKSSAYAWLNWGVSLEKTGLYKEAESAYNMALIRNPNLADAHYNIAILYWKKDWNKVVYELKETLRINPGHSIAAKYLHQIESGR